MPTPSSSRTTLRSQNLLHAPSSLAENSQLSCPDDHDGPVGVMNNDTHPHYPAASGSSSHFMPVPEHRNAQDGELGLRHVSRPESTLSLGHDAPRSITVPAINLQSPSQTQAPPFPLPNNSHIGPSRAVSATLHPSSENHHDSRIISSQPSENEFNNYGDDDFTLEIEHAVDNESEVVSPESSSEDIEEDENDGDELAERNASYSRHNNTDNRNENEDLNDIVPSNTTNATSISRIWTDDARSMDNGSCLLLDMSSADKNASTMKIPLDEYDKSQTLIQRLTTTQITPSSPSSFLRPGSRYEGTQTSERSIYKVDVEIKHIDMRESFLCGYLHIEGLTPDNPSICTYFEGEIIGPKYGFLTKHKCWGADERTDFSHWSKFGAFKSYSKSLKRGIVKEVDFSQKENIFMRWKEHFLVPDHRKCSIPGASFEGFYYICFNQVKGEFTGIYFHAKSEKFQQLHLRHIYQHWRLNLTEFR